MSTHNVVAPNANTTTASKRHIQVKLIAVRNPPRI